MSISSVKLLKFSKLVDERGSLTYLDELSIVPFKIKRIYYLYDLKKNESRGGHAHKLNESLLIALNGEFKVEIEDGSNKKIYLLNKPNEGLYLPKMIWRNLFDFSSNAICLSLASHDYDEKEYIRNYDFFLKQVNIDIN